VDSFVVTEFKNLQLDMLSSIIYSKKNVNDSLDNGTWWNQRIGEFNDSKAFEFIKFNEKYRYFLYNIYIPNEG
jgi:hypothetical protein